MLRDRVRAWRLPGDCNGLPRGAASSCSCPKRPACTPSPTGEAMQPGWKAKFKKIWVLDLAELGSQLPVVFISIGRTDGQAARMDFYAKSIRNGRTLDQTRLS